MLDNFLKFLPLANILAIITGWWLLNRQNNYRETRKEIRALLNDIQKMIGDIEAKGIQFHTEKYNATDRSFLTFQTALMSKKIEIIAKPLKVDRSDQINAFRNSIMSNNWDRDSFRHLEMDSDLVKKIRQHAADLSIQLEKDFSAHYH